MAVAWTTRKYHFRQGSSVCSRFNEGFECIVGDRDQVVDGIPSINRWSDRKDESGTGTVPEDVHRSSARTVAGVVGNGRVCLQ